MLINLLKHAWRSITHREEGSTSAIPTDEPASNELALREHLRKFPEDFEAWQRLGGLLATKIPAHANSAVTIAQAQGSEMFWATTTAAGIAHQAGQHKSALELYRRALALDSIYAGQILTNIGVILKELVRIPEAIDCLEHSIAVRPDFAETYYNLGLILYETGKTNEAERHLQRAIELKPDFAAAQSTLLCICGLNRNSDPERVFSEHRRWAARFADPLMPKQLQFENSLTIDRRLTIAYVSADLCEHSMRFFIEPILANHDRRDFRVLCYDNWHGEDKVNLRLRHYTDGWFKINQMSDEAVATHVRDERVDILVDLSGHTTGNRLLMFARKPAPIQATWLGYMCTTGLLAIDYRITDAYLDPPGQTEQFYTEKLVRMPSAAVFSAAADSPPVNSLPALTKGFITFASLNNYTKIGDDVIATWSLLLQALPSARLLMIVLGGDDPVIQTAIRTRFLNAADNHSASLATRIDIRGRRPLEQFLRTFHEIDIALDPFPYSGGTTSLHTLWMGVPIITMEGDSELSRSTSGMIRACGLDQLIAPDRKGYLEVAIGLAGNLPALSDLRAELRECLASSCMSDGAFATKNLEAVYRSIWSEFVTKQRARTA